LKQSGREWNKEFNGKLTRFGFQRSRVDPCVYVQRNENSSDIAIITVWVDDLLLYALTEARMKETKKQLRSVWEVTNLGEPAKIVGIEISRMANSITISQQKYVEYILKREGLDRANPVSMPMDPNAKIEPNPNGNEGSRSNSYACLIRELQYLAHTTRPDISYAVNRLASYTANPSLQHMGALK